MLRLLENTGLATAGLVFLSLSKIQNIAKGYKKPRAFSSDDIARSVEHDLRVVEDWNRALSKYLGKSDPFAGRTILELGPGPDLGVGLSLLARGAKSYVGCDLFDLAQDVPDDLYHRILERLAVLPDAAVALLNEVAMARSNRPDARLKYVLSPGFDLEHSFAGRQFNLFVSSAAFEHFDDVPSTLAQITALAADDAQLVFCVDLKTHSRWIRDEDPLNIYRYGDALYRMLTYRGSPNRVPTSVYLSTLTQLGWKDVRLIEATAVDHAYFENVRHALHPRFRADETRNVWIVICARR